jgi:hypothetical protein
VRSWGLSVQEQDELWRRWRQGESLRLMARRMSKRGPRCGPLCCRAAGVQQPPPQRPVRSLSAVEREEIGADHGHGPAPRAAGSLVDLGPRQGDGRARPAHRCHRGPVFLCDPRSPWQRASNQNANGLVRQDLPRTADLRRFSQADLDRIAAELNDHPRQIHGLQTPHTSQRKRCTGRPESPSGRNPR